VSDARRLEDPYPRFNYDGRLVVDVAVANCVVRLVSSDTGLPVRVYNVGQSIRGIHISSTKAEMGLLTGKDFLVYDIAVDDDDEDDGNVESAAETGVAVAAAADSSDKQQSSADGGPDAVELLPAEHVTHVTVHRRIVARRDVVTGDMRAIEVSAAGLCDDERDSVMTRLNSARAEQKTVLETWSTPDSNTVIHLYTRIQVIDATKEEIVYSVRSTDRLQRLTSAIRPQRNHQQQSNADQKSIAKDPQVNNNYVKAANYTIGFTCISFIVAQLELHCHYLNYNYIFIDCFSCLFIVSADCDSNGIYLLLSPHVYIRFSNIRLHAMCLKYRLFQRAFIARTM